MLAIAVNSSTTPRGHRAAGRTFLGSPLHKQPREVLTLTEGYYSPKNRDDDRERRACMVQQQMVEKNVYDHWAKKCERERHVAINQQECATSELKGADEEHIVGLNEHGCELARQSGWHHSHRDEIQETV
jgi:hypothetical protein